MNLCDGQAVVNFDEIRVEWGSTSNYTLDYKSNRKVNAANLSISSKAFTILLSARANGSLDPAISV